MYTDTVPQKLCVSRVQPQSSLLHGLPEKVEIVKPEITPWLRFDDGEEDAIMPSAAVNGMKESKPGCIISIRDSGY